MINGFLPKQLADIFYSRPVGDVCTWFDCSDKAIGKGMFATLDNNHFGVYDLCERHASRTIEETPTDTTWSGL